jgi:beta-glucosidase/6-phospho-beta-glucosidase/beta-galactosidase
LTAWITKEYNRPPIYITENGSADRAIDGVNDEQRVRYFRDYINQLLKAVKFDNADVNAYTAWSLMDNYEWAAGYT